MDGARATASLPSGSTPPASASASSACGAATGWRSCRRTGPSGPSPITPASPRAPPTSRSIPRSPPARSSTSSATPAPRPSSFASSRTAGEAAGDPRAPAGAPPPRRVRRDARAAGRAPVRRGARGGRAALARHPGWRAAALAARARRPRHPHLHLGHDRRPQGRDADPREHHVERDRRASALFDSGDRATSASRSCRSRTSSSGCRALLDVPRRRDHQLRRAASTRSRPTCTSSGPRMMALRAAALREDLRAGARQRDGRVSRSSGRSSAGPGGWARPGWS